MRHVSSVVVLSLFCFSCSSRTTTFDAGPGADMAAPDGGATACTMDSQCGDRIACTVDHCTAGVCTHVPCTDCCPGALTCQVSLGCRTAPTPCTVDSECNDMIRCTLDSCRDATECEHTPQPALCATGEICLPAVGCIPEPPSTCTTAADCDRGAYCVGAWSCEPEFGCQFVSLRDCDDGDACTTDTCDATAGACAHAPRDADHDGHADVACGGDDCNDLVATVHPGATETCNMVDDNCDGVVDEGCCASGTCTTACSSTGTTTCTPAGMPGPCVPPAETCNGRDDDCDGVVDNGFGCVTGASMPCMTACSTTGTSTCSATCTPGACVPPAETCNGVDDNCDGTIDEGFACVSGTSTPCMTLCGSTGTRACLPGCTVDSVCTPPAEVCNGVDDNCNSTCDEGFTCCAGSSRACSALGFYSGTAICRGDCTGFDTATCSNCGNGVRDAGEACDGADLGGQTCASVGMGFGGGTLACGAGCMLNTAACSRCGNGVREPALGEQCDLADLGGQTCTGLSASYLSGTLGCTPACGYDPSMCWNPAGLYIVTPAPAYSCALGLVGFNLSNMTITHAGTSMSLSSTGTGSPGLPCSPTGTIVVGTRAFDLTCSAPGGCTETYRLMGMFTDDRHWTGTFTASYAATGAGGCGSCVASRSWSVSGSH